jgi:hypothetical protein
VPLASLNAPKHRAAIQPAFGLDPRESCGDIPQRAVSYPIVEGQVTHNLIKGKVVRKGGV